MLYKQQNSNQVHTRQRELYKEVISGTPSGDMFFVTHQGRLFSRGTGLTINEINHISQAKQWITRTSCDSYVRGDYTTN